MIHERLQPPRRSVSGTGLSANRPGTPLSENEPGRLGPLALRELAAWYRAFAEQAGSPMIWEARLRTAEDLDAEADRLEHQLVSSECEPG